MKNLIGRGAEGERQGGERAGLTEMEGGVGGDGGGGATIWRRRQ